jgi:eukaryotic-like serine/threonine-protein kinase
VTGRRVGGYLLEELLGEGASGVVHRATGEDGAPVAVKLLRPEHRRDATAYRRFLREARLAAEIRSRHLVPIVELAESGGVTYLVMPFYAGGSLRDRLRATRRLEIAETIDLAAQLGRGLDALHARGIVHRDVKPSNVLLEGDGTAALTDFGLALGADWTRLTRDGQVVGTPQYLAPELIEGAEATPASDLYALGCVLYECLAGRPPFRARHPAELAFAHLTEPPPDPRDERPELPVEVALALLTVLEKEPAARPTTATALARMLHVSRTARPA